MGKLIDLTGKRFGRWSVIRYIGYNRSNGAIWECECDCGTIKNVIGKHLRNGNSISCGCYHSDELSKRLTTHGKTNTRIYWIYRQMKYRCSNPHHCCYNIYGGKGITVCDDWANNFESFYNWSMEHGYTDELTIDRIDSSKGYDPSNCRWVSYKVQNNNTSRNVRYTINGETKTISEWCDIYNVPLNRVYNRTKELGWDIEKALKTPLIEKYSHTHNQSK